MPIGLAVGCAHPPELPMDFTCPASTFLAGLFASGLVCHCSSVACCFLLPARLLSPYSAAQGGDGAERILIVTSHVTTPRPPPHTRSLLAELGSLRSSTMSSRVAMADVASTSHAAASVSLAPFPSMGGTELLSAVSAPSKQLSRTFGKRAAVSTASAAASPHPTASRAAVTYIPLSSSPAPTLIQRDPVNDLLVGLDRITARSNSAASSSAPQQQQTASAKRPADNTPAHSSPATASSSNARAGAGAASPTKRLKR